jgi:hypothetical protein
MIAGHGNAAVGFTGQTVAATVVIDYFNLSP